MKRSDIKIFIISVLVLAISCSIGAGSVSALSADGESLLNSLVSAGSSAGIDVDGIIDNYVSTTEQTTSQSFTAGENAQEELDKIFAEIGIGSDVLLITDLISYLNAGGSFADWIYDNYGKNTDIPDSVKAMSTKDLVIYLTGMAIYPDRTTVRSETTKKYVYSSQEFNTQTPASQEEHSVTSQTAEEGSVNETITEPTVLYVSGDVDSDGKVRANDARLALRASAKLEKLEGSAFEAADVNNDGRITANDARSILRYSAKLTSGF